MTLWTGGSRVPPTGTRPSSILSPTTFPSLWPHFGPGSGDWLRQAHLQSRPDGCRDLAPSASTQVQGVVWTPEGATCTPGAEGGRPTGVWEAGEDREHAGAVPSSWSLCLAEWHYLNVTVRWSPHRTALLTEMSPTVLASLQTDAASKQLRVSTATVTFPLTM